MNPNLLIILTEPPRMERFQALFELLGCRTNCVKTGVEAERILKSQSAPDLIILDLQLEDMFPNVFTNIVKAHPVWKKIPIVPYTSTMEYRLTDVASAKLAPDVAQRYAATLSYLEHIPGEIIIWVSIALEQSGVSLPEPLQKISALLCK